MSNQQAGGDGYPKHPYAPILQAVMLRKEYDHQYQETKAAFIGRNAEATFYERFGPTGLIPVFHYSGLHNQLEIVPEDALTDDKIVDLWVGMCSDFITESLHQRHASNITTMSINEIKVRAMYGEIISNSRNFRDKTRSSADMNYSEKLQQKINDAIETQRARLVKEDAEEWRKQILCEELSLVEDRVFYKIMENQSLLATFPEAWIKEAIRNLAQSPTWFKSSLGGRFFKWDCSSIFDKKKIIKLCAQPLSDLFITAHEEEQNMIFENQAVRLYAICKLVRDDDLIQLVKEKAIAMVVARIEEIKRSSDNWIYVGLFPDRMNELTQLDYFSKVFDIDLQLKMQLDTMKNAIFRQISDYDYPLEAIEEYLSAVDILQSLHWFNANIDMTPAKKTLALFAIKLAGHVVDTNKTLTATIVDPYLKLCTLLKQQVDKEVIKAFLLNNMSVLRRHFLIGYSSGLRNILTYLPLTDENNDMFTIMTSYFQPLTSWSAYLEALKKVLPNQIFSENQLLIVQRNLDIWGEKALNTQSSVRKSHIAFVTPASMNFTFLLENVKFCTEIQANLQPSLEVPACILQSLLNYLNQYAEQLPSPPESFISQKDSERLQNTLILQIEGINKKLSRVNPELSAVIERIRANPLAGATLAT